VESEIFDSRISHGAGEPGLDFSDRAAPSFASKQELPISDITHLKLSDSASLAG